MNRLMREEEEFFQHVERWNRREDNEDRNRVKLAFIKGSPWFEVKRDSLRILEIVA